MKNLVVVIPAINKSPVIPGQLLKKLNGKLLIQRSIDISKELTDNIIVLTDNEEIALIAERNKINFVHDEKLNIDSSNLLDVVDNYVKTEKDILIFRANTPLIKSKTLKEAYKLFKKNRKKILISVKKLNKILYKHFLDLQKENGEYFEEIKAFVIYNQSLSNRNKLSLFVLNGDEAIEIESYQSWWICEKLLKRKRIIFNVIGNIKVGMGHIYRALSLAHEITDHEIIFVCREEDKLAVESIASKDYKVIESKDVKKTLIELNPDLVINDILNTKKDFILALKKKGIKIVNFEDVGEGAKYADIVFNELYEDKVLPYKNILWGYEWYFLRDEFENANVNTFRDEINKILITFGGTDQHNLTMLTLKNLLKLYKKLNIKIPVEVVCGGGYLYKNELDKFTKNFDFVNVTYKTGVISKKMEECDIAITSNGRTVYELAHMHIPSIVISQHERENTHKFSKLENGFINLGIFNNNTEDKLLFYLEKLLMDKEYRYLLFLNISKFNFLPNKQKVIKKIMELL